MANASLEATYFLAVSGALISRFRKSQFIGQQKSRHKGRHK